MGVAGRWAAASGTRRWALPPTTGTSPPPPRREAVIAAFPGCSVNRMGMRHGTVGVLLDGQMLEITTFRREGSYSDFRHPRRGSPSPAACGEDLSRRDFTVNAMALHPLPRLLRPVRRPVRLKGAPPPGGGQPGGADAGRPAADPPGAKVYRPAGAGARPGDGGRLPQLLPDAGADLPGNGFTPN